MSLSRPGGGPGGIKELQEDCRGRYGDYIVIALKKLQSEQKSDLLPGTRTKVPPFKP